jgi:hypothetical protein
MVSVRLANFVCAQGISGRALDIYDDLTGVAPTASTKPLVANLAFGAVSDYVHPHVVPAGSSHSSLVGAIALTALPAGSPPTDTADATSIWELGPDDGSHPQITVLLTYDGSNLLDAGPLESISYSSFVEKGHDVNDGSGPVAPPPPSGQGEFLAFTQGVPQSVISAGSYFFVDDSCTPPLNGDPSSPGVPYLFAADTPAYGSTPFALFATTPGSHQLTLASWTDSQAPMCSDLTQRQGATTATIAAGQQIFAFVYGTSVTDLHIVTAPIAP